MNKTKTKDTHFCIMLNNINKLQNVPNKDKLTRLTSYQLHTQNKKIIQNTRMKSKDY